MTKAATAANYVFWLRRLKPAVQEDPLKPPFDDDRDRKPMHTEIQDVAFAYESRPHAKVLEGIDADVSVKSFHQRRLMLTIQGSTGPIYRLRRRQRMWQSKSARV